MDMVNYSVSCVAAQLAAEAANSAGTLPTLVAEEQLPASVS